MKLISATVIGSFLVACAAVRPADQEKFEAAPSSIDARLDTASIEDYIIALPPFAYHEESVGQFAERVRQARASETENHDKNADQLFVGGDGSAPSKEFRLNRSKRLLTIRTFNWEPGFPDMQETMRRVPGGWMRGPGAVVKTAEQKAADEAAASNG